MSSSLSRFCRNYDPRNAIYNAWVVQNHMFNQHNAHMCARSMKEALTTPIVLPMNSNHAHPRTSKIHHKPILGIS